MTALRSLQGSADLAVVEVGGADARSFLEATLSQRVEDLEPGHWRGALWLDIHGAPVAGMDVVAPPGGDALLMVVPSDLVDTVVDGLGGRTFLSDVTLRPRTDLVVLAVRGPAPASLADVAEGSVQSRGNAMVLGRADGVNVLANQADLAAITDALAEEGVVAADADALRAAEVVAGTPAWGVEVVAPNLPEEYGLLPTHVHLDKGCYPGQEAVARMWMLGRPRRRLARLAVGGDAQPGAEAGQGRQRVRLTSVAGDRALGFVPPDASAGDRFDGDGWQAEVIDFVGDDRTVVGHQPGVARRRDRR